MRAGIRRGSGAGVFGFCIRMQSRALTRRFAPPSPASQERGSRSTPRGLAAGRESSDKLDVLVVARLLFHVALPGGTGQLGVDRGRGLGGLLRGDAARPGCGAPHLDRKTVVWGKGVAGRVALGG